MFQVCCHVLSFIFHQIDIDFNALYTTGNNFLTKYEYFEKQIVAVLKGRLKEPNCYKLMVSLESKPDTFSQSKFCSFNILLYKKRK